jgi:hypothetical protein
LNRIAILVFMFLYGCAAPPPENIAYEPALLKPYVGTWQSAPAPQGPERVVFKIELADIDLKLTRYIYTDPQGASHDLLAKTTLTRGDRDVVIAGTGPQGNDFTIVLSPPGSRFMQGQLTYLGQSFSVQYLPVKQ